MKRLKFESDVLVLELVDEYPVAEIVPSSPEDYLKCTFKVIAMDDTTRTVREFVCPKMLGEELENFLGQRVCIRRTGSGLRAKFIVEKVEEREDQR